MTSRIVKDENDGGLSNLVFDEGNKERPPWRCCSNTVVPLSEIIKFSKAGIIVLMIFLCCFSYQRALKKSLFGLHCFQV